MGILSWIILGLVAGMLAKFIMPGKDPGGFIITTILGVLGAMLGGWIGTLLGFGSVTGFNIMGLVLAIGGALLLLFAYRIIKGRRRAA
ncbi:MAG: GlsB/YeaQ/YmgE family stress response membrane protein [Verrucomicrobiales bacterium]|nr:GlsB/YeaQ/YmgE family stress response membrane protein [Verrucomicrobiales bacterium]